jgi:glycosyltransferase involved in cell wall biosynthesis
MEVWEIAANLTRCYGSKEIMRIWVTEIGEPLPFEKNARLLRYGMLLPLWAKLGHDVTWWTSSFSHANRTFVRRSDSDEVWKDVRIKVLHGPGYRSSVSLKRVWHQTHFARRFAEESLREEKPDVILSPIPTLEVSRKTIGFGEKYNVPVFVDIRDEWPEEFLDLFPQSLRPLGRLALWKSFSDMSYICKRATGIIGTGQKFLEYGLKYAQRQPRPQDAIFPFGYQEPEYSKEQLETEKNWWIGQGVKSNHFLVVFFGTIGNFFDLKTVVEAAKNIEGSVPIQFVICGNGSRLLELKNYAQDVSNVLFPGWVNGVQISSLMAMAQVGIAPYKLGARMSLPNKPIEYLAGGLPVVSSLPGELEHLIKEFDCGRFYRADNSESLISILKELISNPPLLERYKANAKKLYRSKFSLEQIAQNMVNHFERALTSPV